MLTTKVITPRQGESYYAKENYYSAEQSVEHSEWIGQGAKKLGLKGHVKAKDFKKLLYGELPDGTRFRTRKKERAGYKERAGLDCTFSAPKSVSIQALVFGDKRLEEIAHKEAVRRTLAIIEKDYATTRVMVDGKVQVIKTHNLVVGQFHHDTSRELDPHLHSHCVIINATQAENGKWYSLRNDDIFANRKLLGMIYQNELALQVQKLGYEIEPKEHGQFEIKGFTPEQLESFSKRRQQIKSQLGDESTWREREKVWDKTRIAKGEPIPRSELQQYWRSQFEDLEVEEGRRQEADGRRFDGRRIQILSHQRPLKPRFREVLNPNKESNNKLFPSASCPLPSAFPKQTVCEAVADGIEHCSERTVVFKPEDIKKFVFSEVGNYRYEDVEKAITESNELIHLDGQVTTQTALMREMATIRLMEQGKGAVSQIASPNVVDKYLEGLCLTVGQREAIALAATTTDQFIAWQGKAGAGKTYALNEFREIAQERGYTVKGYAPSAKAASVLADELGIETTTVARKLVSQPLEEEAQQKQIWIVDEAGLLGAKNAFTLLERAMSENARVLLVGDIRQFSSVEAGNPFKSLQQAGITTAYLNQSLRQKTQDLKQAVEHLASGEVKQGVDILEANHRIEEIQHFEVRTDRIAQDYLDLPPSEREQTLVLAGTNKEREAIEAKIREGLKREGSLGQEIKIKRLESKDLTTIQKKYAHYYQSYDVVIPLGDYKRLGLEKGKQYRVEAVKKDLLTLTDEAGTVRKVNPASFKYKEVYQVKETEMAIGDRLRWTKNDNHLGRTNGQQFVVTNIVSGNATIKNESGTEEKINLNVPQHLAHTLVTTNYSSQGQTANRVLVSASNDLTLSFESFYVAASRAKYNIKLYVENRDELVEKASRSRAQLNPIDLLREKNRQQVATESLVGVPEKAEKNASTQTTYNQTTSKKQNHERIRSHPTRNDLQGNPNRSTRPSYESSRTPRTEPPRFTDWARKLSQGINDFTQQQETESLAGAIEKFDCHLRDCQFSIRETERFAESVEQFHRTIAANLRQQTARHLINAIADYIEQSTLESEPQLHDAIALLTLNLKAQKFDERLDALTRLTNAINDYTQVVQNQSLKERASQLASAITHTVESLEIESLTDAIEQFNTHLKDYEAATENLNHLAATINQFEQAIILNSSKQTIQDALDALTDYVEQSTLESEPNLAASVEKLISKLDRLEIAKAVAISQQLQETITDYSQQLEPSPIVTSAPGSMFDPTENFTVAANNETKPIEIDPPNEQVIISQKLELLSRQLEDLQPKTRKQKRERDFLERKIANLQAYSQLSPGQQVSKDEQKGIITQLKLTKGGMPEAWVQWDNSPVPVPEQPERLQVVSPQQLSLEQNDDHPQQSQSTDGEDIGRRIVSRLNASNREVRRDRGQIDRTETRPSTQSSDRTNEEAVERPTTGLQQFSSNTGQFKRGFESSTREIRHSTSPTRQTDGQTRSRVNLNVGRNWFNRSDVERARGRFREDFQQRRELTQRIRSVPLEEVAERLGMERDRADKRKWRSHGCIISINDGKFYDHLAQKGGGGAIDLVMHVQESNFKEAVEWLDSGAFNLPPAHQHSPLPSEPIERPPFQAPNPDEAKWAAVKDYLIEKRGIPESLVEQLHQQGDLYADSKQNAVFLRKSLSGEITGASLRGTYKDSQFKGLATGTRREGGWFRVTKGEGEPERIVLTEAPIDTLSAAAIAQKPETTMFISIDGAGSIPSQWLQQQLSQGKQVLVAYDADEAGEQMAQQVLSQLPGAQRIKPTIGKDWNEQLIRSKGEIEKQRQSYRQEYLQLQEKVKSNPSFETASTEKTDIAIAMLILKHDKQAPLNRVGQVLSQSDLVKEWKRSLSEGEYKTKAKDYITKTYEQASTLRQELISKKQKKCDLEL